METFDNFITKVFQELLKHGEVLAFFVNILYAKRFLRCT